MVRDNDRASGRPVARPAAPQVAPQVVPDDSHLQIDKFRTWPGLEARRAHANGALP